ncbi:MAG: EamA family transporter, partial [Vallitaleaceae bacterium]|nr:EamA family transporter [Vallitaleaceae bacterium]
AAILFIKHESANHPIEITLLGNLLTFILAIPFYFSQSITPTDLSGLLFLGVFQLGLSYILYTAAISHVSSLEAILIPILEPLLNPVWVLLFTGEIPGIPALIGGVIVIATLIIRDLHQRSKDLTFS